MEHHGRPRLGGVRRWWPVLRWVLAVATLGLAGWVISGQSTELAGAGQLLTRLRWPWVLAAVAVEAVSYLGSASLQRVLLASGGVRLGWKRSILIGLATTAMQNSLPAGAAFAGVFAYRQYRRIGADEVLSAWAVVTVTVLLFLGLTGLSVVGLVLAFGTGSALDLVEVICGLAAAGAALVVLWARRSWILDRAARVAHRLHRRFARRSAGSAEDAVLRLRRRLSAVSPSPRSWAAGLAAGTWTWALDLLCLTCAFAAVGAPVPWRGLLLAYGAAQLAAVLPITPGGLGVVEGSLTIALVAFGGVEASAVAAVLVYRVISYWAELPVGWGASLWASRLRAPAAVPAVPVGAPAAEGVA